LASNYRRQHARTCNALPEGERLFLQSLAQCDVEDLISSMMAWADPGEINPLQRYDPFAAPETSSATMNGKRYHHA
jgi:hypothetical protein